MAYSTSDYECKFKQKINTNTPRCVECTVCVRSNNAGNLETYCGYGSYGTPNAYRRITGPDALKTSPMWCPKRKCNAVKVK